MAKTRRSTLEVLKDQADELVTLEAEKKKYDALGKKGNAAAVLAAVQIGLHIASLVRAIKRRKKRRVGAQHL